MAFLKLIQDLTFPEESLMKVGYVFSKIPCRTPAKGHNDFKRSIQAAKSRLKSLQNSPSKNPHIITRFDKIFVNKISQNQLRFFYTHFKSEDHSIDKTSFEFCNIFRATKTCAMNAKKLVSKNLQKDSSHDLKWVNKP